jgi:hypothetical protein
MNEIENTPFCPECGWEQVVVPDSASEDLKEMIKGKKLLYKQHYDRFKKAADEVVQSHNEIAKLQEELAKVNQQSAFVGRRLCILTENRQSIIVLNVGEFTFGRLGPATKTHFVFLDDAMDSKHFALQIAYNLPDGSLYSCKIRNIGSKETFINTTKKIDSEWVSIDANDEISAGNTKMKLVLTK